MKHKSLKLRITFWFTMILAVICIVILISAMAVYQVTDRRIVKDKLVKVVEQNVRQLEREFDFDDEINDDSDRDEIEDEDRFGTQGAGNESAWEKISDFADDSDYLQDNVQLMIFNENGAHIGGLFLYSELNQLPFSGSGFPQEIIMDGKTYYYYDKMVGGKRMEEKFREDFTENSVEKKPAEENRMWVRGVIYANDSLYDVTKKHIYMVILFPVLLILAFVGGYWLTGRFLEPIKKINRTAEEIRNNGDLTKRIEIKENGDELSELARTFNSMFDRLEENFTAETVFASNASHELRTPVAVILAECEYAFENAEDKQELYDAIASIQKQGYRMSHLIETLLVFTRIEQNTEKYPKQKTNLCPPVRSSCEDFQLIADKEITIEADCPDELYAAVNRELFMMMVNNLIQNAIRYGREKGYVHVRMSEEGDFVKVTVSDNGLGISEEELPHIWNRFYRGDRSRSSQGTGLGLALVKQISAYHGGTVSVVSQLHEGSEFTVTVRK